MEAIDSRSRKNKTLVFRTAHFQAAIWRSPSPHVANAYAENPSGFSWQASLPEPGSEENKDRKDFEASEEHRNAQQQLRGIR
jgi:hypothetical protein